MIGVKDWCCTSTVENKDIEDVLVGFVSVVHLLQGDPLMP